MEYHIIYNPAAGKGRAKKAVKKATNYLTEQKISFFIHTTEKPKHATKITASLTKNDKDKTIIIFGGDGTLSEAINGIVNFNSTRVALIPCGSGNDFSANFKSLSRKDPIKSLKAILKQNVTEVDYLLVNNKIRCINVLGTGLDTDITCFYRKIRFGTPYVRYRLAIIYRALFFRWHHHMIKIDNNPSEEHKTILIAIANGTQYGSGMKICPDAKLTDRKITYFVGKEFNRIKTPWALLQVMRGKIKKLKFASIGDCESIEVKLDDGLFQVDGELYIDTPVINVKVGKEKIKFLS